MVRASTLLITLQKSVVAKIAFVATCLGIIVGFGIQQQYLAQVHSVQSSTKATSVPSVSVKPSMQATASSSASPSVTVVLGVQSKAIASVITLLPSPSVVIIPSPVSQAPSPTIAPQIITPTPSATAVASSSALPTESPKQITLAVKTPDDDKHGMIQITDGMDVCDVLQTAKNEGLIKSVTFDYSYLAAYKSRYVVEINGFQNNWTFTVNGISPLGCSLAKPKSGDNIVWKFG